MKDDVIKVQEPIRLIAKQILTGDELLQAEASINEDEAIQRNTIGEMNEPNGEKPQN